MEPSAGAYNCEYMDAVSQAVLLALSRPSQCAQYPIRIALGARFIEIYVFVAFLSLCSGRIYPNVWNV